MSALNEIARARYSCRKYLDTPVERGKIIKCIECARLAPSACNAQPWNFIVLDQPEILKRASGAAASGKYGFSRFIKSAPVIIVVSADRGSFISRAGSFIRDTTFYLIDIGIACEHIVLQAAELELATCYIGWFNEKALKKELSIPRSAVIPLLICMGYPDRSHMTGDPVRRRAASSTRRPIEDIIKFNGYRKT